jgi:hypothetical protein
MVGEKIVEILRQENGYIAVSKPADGELSIPGASPVYPLDPELQNFRSLANFFIPKLAL